MNFKHKSNIYKEAIQVQDACNLSGVAHSFSRILDSIWEEARSLGKGTEYVNTHPVCKMFADKITDLARVREFSAFNEAMSECEKLSKEYDEGQEAL
jgi:hypothetical protein